MATRNGGRPGRRRTRSASSASGSGAAKAITPCGASLRARCVELAAGDVGDRHPVRRGQGDDVGDAVVGLPSARRARSTARSRAPGGARRSAARARPGDPRPARRRGPWPALGRVRVAAVAADGARCARRRGCAAPGPAASASRRGVERRAGDRLGGRPPRAGGRRRAPARPTPSAGRRRPPRPLIRRPPPPTTARPRPARRSRAALTLPRRARRRRSRRCPRSRPSAPSPSGRRPLTVTGAPTAPPSRRLHLVAHGRQSGALADRPSNRRCRSTTRRRAPRRRPGAAARSSRRPRSAGSVSGKCWPMSPSPAAPSSASATAWATASPSLWPTSPGTPGNRQPPSTSGRAGSSPKRCTSKPWPTRISRLTRAALAGRASGAARLEVVGLGDLAVPRLAGHRRRPRPPSRLDERGVVGAVVARGVGPAQHAARNACGRLHGDERRPLGRRDDGAGGVDDLDRVGHRHRRDGRVGAGVHRRDDRARTAPATPAAGRRRARTRSSASAGTAASPARTDSLRVAPPATPPSRGGVGRPARRPRRRRSPARAASTATSMHAALAERLVLLGARRTADRRHRRRRWSRRPRRLAAARSDHVGRVVPCSDHGARSPGLPGGPRPHRLLRRRRRRDARGAGRRRRPSASSSAATSCSTRATRPTRCTS